MKIKRSKMREIVMASVAVMKMMMSAQAGTVYVTPTGGGVADGSDWDNAYSNVQQAVTASVAGGTIRLRYGTYTVTNQIVIDSLSGLTIKGGGLGSTSEPDALTNAPTVLTRDLAFYTRILTITNSTVTLDSLAITGGSLDAAVNYGMGLYVSASHVTLTNCVVANNSRERLSTTFYGAGLYAAGGSLTVADSRFTNNFARAWNDGSSVFGGAIYTVGTAVNVTGTTFDRNSCQAKFLITQGGAIYMSSGSATISDCFFTTNSVLKSENYGHNDGRGGAICAKNLSSLDILDSVFIGNYNNELNGRGGSIYLEGASQKTRISRCAMYANGTRPGAKATDSGSLYLLSGNLYMTNVLHAANLYGNSLDIGGGTAEAVNCTFAGNVNGYGINQTAGSLALRNCIVWGNASGAYNFAGGTRASFNYCFVQDAQAGIANSTADPRFANTVYYHPRSRAGVYTNGYFKGGAWSLDPSVDSPTIDAGDPASLWVNELQPNRHRVNVGYDANTAVASKSTLGEPPVFDSLMAYTYPATNISSTTAWARGEVAHTGGGEDPTVYLVWGTSDFGTTALADWEPNVRSLGAQSAWQVFSSELTGLVSGAVYYRLFATNSTGSVWSAPVASFYLVSLPMISNDGVSHIARTTARVYGAVVDTGFDPPAVTLHWWPENSAVTSSVALGKQSGAFTANISGLIAGTSYVYRVQAVNGAGTVVADSTFQTLPTTPLARYVTPIGSGVVDGSNWANAYSNLQDAVTDCTVEGDEIYMKHGTYAQTQPNINEPSHCLIVGKPGLTIRGEYVGSGSPGDRTNAPTTLTRNPAVYRRLIDGLNSTLTLDRMTLEGGALSGGGSQGAGARFTTCQVLLTHCTLRANGMNSSGALYGGGIYAYAGALTLEDCLLTGNYSSAAYDNSYTQGGAIWCNYVDLRLTGCTFVQNRTDNLYHTSQGGALCLNNGNAWIADCNFQTNYVSMHETHPTTLAYGGTLFASGLSSLEIRNCTFSGGYQRGVAGAGGLIYLAGASQKNVITRCVMVDNGQTGHSGNVHLQSGMLNMTNVLYASTGVGSAMKIAGGTATAVNCTFADHATWGIENTAGTATVLNSIAWGNVEGGLSNCVATYTCSQEVLTGAGNFVDDPLFADTTFYHLSSSGGTYANGYFEGGEWVRGMGKSPCIDAGDPASVFDQELPRRGRAINLGAYGNTSVASISPNDATTIVIR